MKFWKKSATPPTRLSKTYLTRPYAKKLQELLSNIVSSGEGASGIKLAEEREVVKVLLIVITSDRGLCGAYNSNIIKLAKQTIAEKYDAQFKKGNVSIWNIGKKGFESMLKSGYKASDTYRDLFHHLSFENVQVAAQAAIKAFDYLRYLNEDTIFHKYSDRL